MDDYALQIIIDLLRDVKRELENLNKKLEDNENE